MSNDSGRIVNPFVDEEHDEDEELLGGDLGSGSSDEDSLDSLTNDDLGSLDGFDSGEDSGLDALPDLSMDLLSPGDYLNENLPDSSPDNNYYDIDYSDYDNLDRKPLPDSYRSSHTATGSIPSASRDTVSSSYDHDDFSSVSEDDENDGFENIDFKKRSVNGHDDGSNDRTVFDEGDSGFGEVEHDEVNRAESNLIETDDENLRSGYNGLEELLNITGGVSSDVDEDDDDYTGVNSASGLVVNLDRPFDLSGNGYGDDEKEEEYSFRLPLDDILTKAIDMEASDVDIHSNDEVSFAILGDMVRIPEFGVVSARHAANIYLDITSHRNQDVFLQELELDTSYQIRSGKYSGRRLRLNVSKSFDNYSLVFRVISDRIPDVEELGLDPRLLEWTTLPNGLVLLNGKTGQGKELKLDTPILTPSGWTTMGDIKPGDRVYDARMNECNVTVVYDIDNNPNLYRMTFSDGQVVFADADHQWIVSSRGSRNYRNHPKAVKSLARKTKALEDADAIYSYAQTLNNDDCVSVSNMLSFLKEKEWNTEIRFINMIYRALAESNVDYIDGKPKQYRSRDAFESLSTLLKKRFVIQDTPILKTMTTQQMIDEGIEVRGTYKNFAVPIVESTVSTVPDKELAVDPYVLGVWLGDGGKNRSSIVSGISDSAEMAELLKNKGYRVCVDTPDKSPNLAYLTLKALSENHNTLIMDLKKSYGLKGDKRIPVDYLTASHSQRLSLLQGLMDTDGTIDKRTGVCELTLSKKDLAYDSLQLIRSLGIKAEIKKGKAGYRNSEGVYIECQDRYRIVFATSEPVFALERKKKYLHSVEDMRDTNQWNYIVSVEPVLPGDKDYGPARCISVDSPDNSYLCADFVVTHNSTTLASLIRRIQMTRYDKIVTVEKPVEYTYGVAGRGVVVQREVGRDTLSFSNALDSAMRQHPDVILIGEVRNQVEVNALLYAAETGHLAFSTMHTNSAAATLSRIKRLYKGEEQTMVLGDLSEVSRGFASQVLVKRPEGDARFAVAEILEIDEDVKKLILNGDSEGMIQYQIENKSTLEHELAKAVVAGKCTREEAMRVSFVRPRLEQILKDYG